MDAGVRPALPLAAIPVISDDRTLEATKDIRPREAELSAAERDPHGEAVGRSVLRIWLGFLLPPAVALLNLMFGFVLGHIGCEYDQKLQVHIFMVACLGIVGIGALLSWREWTALGEETSGEIRGPLGTRRFMALTGLMGAAISAYIILAQWFPAFIIAPCMRT